MLNTTPTGDTSEFVNSLVSKKVISAQPGTHALVRRTKAEGKGRRNFGWRFRPLSATRRRGRALGELALHFFSRYKWPGDILRPPPPWQPTDSRARFQVHFGGVQSLLSELRGRKKLPF